MGSGSIMNLSSTGGGGRGSDRGEIIGAVINHGKKRYWTAQGSYHYHCTLQKGENTLEAQLVRVVCRSLVENGGQFRVDDLRSRYVDFMTTPGSHNDCYASTCHRMFFANMTKGLPAEKCPDNDHHNVDTIDGLIMAIPVSLMHSSREAAQCVAVTRKSDVLSGYVDALTDMLHQLLEGTPLQEVLASTSGGRMERTVRNAPHSSDPVVA